MMTVLKPLSDRFTDDMEKELNLQSSQIQSWHGEKFVKARKEANNREKRQQNGKLTPKLIDAN